MSDDTVLSADNLWVQFGSFVAVKSVSLHLRGGELIGLIGPNGAGKTTLLRTLAGMQPSTRGGVRILGEPLTPGTSPLVRHIGFTPDTPPLYEDLTVRGFLQFIAKGYDLGSEAAERIDFWLEKVWLTEKANTKIRQLSRGMRQRVGIARTLLPNPNIVLLDEPSSGLDPAGRVQFRQLLCSLRDQGKVLIVSSHILLDMGEYCTHVAIMSKGEIVKYGTVAEIAGGTDPTRCRYSVVLAHPVAAIESTLADIEGVTNITSDGPRIVLEFSSDADEAARLLATMVQMNLPVASFSPNALGLEEAYLRTEVAQVD